MLFLLHAFSFFCTTPSENSMEKPKEDYPIIVAVAGLVGIHKTNDGAFYLLLPKTSEHVANHYPMATVYYGMTDSKAINIKYKDIYFDSKSHPLLPAPSPCPCRCPEALNAYSADYIQSASSLTSEKDLSLRPEVLNDNWKKFLVTRIKFKEADIQSLLQLNEEKDNQNKVKHYASYFKYKRNFFCRQKTRYAAEIVVFSMKISDLPPQLKSETEESKRPWLILISNFPTKTSHPMKMKEMNHHENALFDLLVAKNDAPCKISSRYYSTRAKPKLKCPENNNEINMQLSDLEKKKTLLDLIINLVPNEKLACPVLNLP
ncbi:MAG: hypothetical protein H6510_07645 [Acidobacteria bacterium]|nr:hypothetical protein [Acidobacteriota bacterium]